MATVERGQRIRVALEDLGRLGEAKATLDGKPLFVSGGIPGEEVEVEVILHPLVLTQSHRHLLSTLMLGTI